MSIVEGAKASGLVERVKSILLQPTATWTVIENEPATPRALFVGYVMILAAIPPVASLIHALVFGEGMFGFHWRPSPVAAVLQAIIDYAVGVGGVFVGGLIIDALAPSFGGEKDSLKSLKLAAYSGTAAWVASALLILPFGLGVLSIVGLYSAYLFYVGAPLLMKVPREKVIPYTAVIVVCCIGVALVVGLVTGPIRNMGRIADNGHLSGTVSLPGGGKVDLDQIQAASARATAASKAIQDGKEIKVVAPEALQAVMPGDVNGFTRGEVSTQSSGAGGFNVSSAEATYTRGDSNFRLTVSDMGAAGAMGGLAAAMSFEHTERHGASYEKVGKVDGRTVMEKYDADNKHAEYSVLAGDHMMIAAEGDNVSVDDLKAAISAVDPGRVADLKP
ncbi:MAG: hypothetical protein JWP35_181 [Caulobacter sp.]|nr:hypothetical protein [Caulobacter sp.]